MDSKRIEELLNKYWECETSLEEEQQLREYFTGNNIPPQFTESAQLFRFFSQQKKKSITDAAFDSRMVKNVRSEKSGRVVPIFYNSMRIAAGLAVLMVAGWFIKTEVRKSTPQEIIDTYDDPHLAFEETKKALMMISRGFGKAEDEAKKINLFNEAREEIQKSDSNKSQL
jgi:hypothetical protein